MANALMIDPATGQPMDPYAAFRRLPANTFRYSTGADDQAMYDQVSGNYIGQSDPEGWSSGQDFENLLAGTPFQSKYSSRGFEHLGDNRFGITMQQPGAHKYDTMLAEYGMDPATGEWVLQNDPMDAPTRQISSGEQFRDRAEQVAALAAAAGTMYFGGGALMGLGGGAGGAAAGAGAGGVGGTFGGALGADAAAGLVGGGLGGAGSALTAPGAFAAGGGLASGGALAAGGLGATYGGYGADAAAGLVGGGGGGAGSALTAPGAFTPGGGLASGGGAASFGGASLGGGGNMGNVGTSLADFFTGNGNLSDYLRAGSTLYGMYANNRATDAASQGQSEANALMRQMYEQNRADNQPLLDMRNSTLPKIQSLLANPSSITSDPGYQFGLNQGQSQIDNQAAARGGYYSGAQMKASQRYGQDYAGTKLNDSMNRLMGVAGLGQIGATANQANNTNYSQMGSGGLAQQGNIRGSGYMGQANTLLNGVNSGMQDYWWNQALRGGGP
jgi:hypothetical protein